MTDLTGVCSLFEVRGLPAAGNAVQEQITVAPPAEWLCEPPASLFGHNLTRAAFDTFQCRHVCHSTPVRLVTLRDVLVSPKGLVFLANGSLIYETLFPWQLENFLEQFSSDVTIVNGRVTALAPEKVETLDSMVLCREGSEVGYFHFINSILPRLALYRRIEFNDNPPISISTHAPFARQMYQLLSIQNMLPVHAWRRVGVLRYLPPFTFQGDHFTRPRFTATLLDELLLPLIGERTSASRLYLTRSDASVRKLVNEADFAPILDQYGIVPVTIGNMPVADQIDLFKSCTVLIAPHGAGLANMAFMPKGSTIIEIVSPSRLWPTFRTMAARHGHSYHAVIGDYSHKVEGQSPIDDGNSDFVCDPVFLHYALREYELIRGK